MRGAVTLAARPKQLGPEALRAQPSGLWLGRAARLYELLRRNFAFQHERCEIGLNPERLGVIARQSAMAYKGTKKRADEIGRELGVDYLVGGSVRRDDHHVRVTAHLIQVSDQSELWAESHDRDVRDLLTLESEVAGAIAEKISIALAPRVAPPSRHVVPIEAHEAYLLGRFWLNKRIPETLEKAVACFERAAEIDPAYPLAYTGLADCYDLAAYYGTEPPKIVYPKAGAAAAKAIALDPSLPEAHALLAEVSYLYEWKWDAAEREFRQAIELGPNCVVARQWYGVFLSLVGQHDRSLAELGAAAELDPLSVVIATGIGLSLYDARRYDEAIERFRRTLELDPSFPLAHIGLGMAYLQKSLNEQAMAEFRRARELAPGDLTTVSLLGYGFAVARKRREARKILQNLDALAKKRYVSAAYPAAVHLGLGEFATALDLAEEACGERSGSSSPDSR